MKKIHECQLTDLVCFGFVLIMADCSLGWSDHSKIKNELKTSARWSLILADHRWSQSIQFILSANFVPFWFHADSGYNQLSKKSNFLFTDLSYCFIYCYVCLRNTFVIAALKRSSINMDWENILSALLSGQWSATRLDNGLILVWSEVILVWFLSGQRHLRAHFECIIIFNCASASVSNVYITLFD